MMTLRTLVLAIVTLTTAAVSGCVPAKPYTTTGQADWTSPLDGDLRIAAAHLSDDLATQGYPGVHVLWAGARFHEYTIARGPTGEPVSKYAQVEYAFQLADGKCYLDSDFSTLGSGPMVVRSNEGGARYGEPRIRGFAPPKVGFGGRHEILCDVVAQATGGAHEPFTP